MKCVALPKVVLFETGFENAAAKPQTTVLSVSALTERIKSVLEGGFPHLCVRGELSNFKAYASGHYYFTLKDQDAQISGVMFRGQNRLLGFEPRDGQSVLAYGRLAVYGPRGQYQIIVDRLESDGVGDLRVAFEKLKEKLKGEGLFESSRKRDLPLIPATIGVVTSWHGAVMHDILSVLKRRHPSLIVKIYPVKVQGDGAAAEVVAALDYFSRTKSVDVVIVGRGGGSLEDLWAFNEEPVVRAVASSSIPVVSAVGHETDFTLCDFAADVRAPTPSAAAELCAPSALELKRGLAAFVLRLAGACKHKIAATQRDVSNLRLRLPAPTALRDRLRLRVAHAEDRLFQSMVLRVRDLKLKLSHLRVQMRSPEQTLAFAARRLSEAKLKLDLLSPHRVLERGYALVRRPSGEVVTQSAQAESGQDLHLLFHDGNVVVSVKSSHHRS